MPKVRLFRNAMHNFTFTFEGSRPFDNKCEMISLTEDEFYDFVDQINSLKKWIEAGVPVVELEVNSLQ